VALVYGELLSSHFINSAVIITKEDALRIMEEDMGNGFEEMIGVNPFPYSIDFTVKEEWANLDSLAGISTRFMANPLVRELHYPTVVIRQVEANFRLIGWVLFGVAMGFLAISITLINSTVRLTIYSKRFLVKSMQLVGATRAFIRRPFVLESIFTGLMAALLACLSLLGILLVMTQVNPELNLVGSMGVLGLIFGSIALLGFAITAVSSYFAVNKFLNLKLEELY
jgi:cell division transport system permease protein